MVCQPLVAGAALVAGVVVSNQVQVTLGVGHLHSDHRLLYDRAIEDFGLANFWDSFMALLT
jgi:hypothetical protein